MTQIAPFAKAVLDLEAVKDIVKRTLEEEHPEWSVVKIAPQYTRKIGYHEDQFPSDPEFSGFEVTFGK